MVTWTFVVHASWLQRYVRVELHACYIHSTELWMWNTHTHTLAWLTYAERMDLTQTSTRFSLIRQIHIESDRVWVRACSLKHGRRKLESHVCFLRAELVNVKDGNVKQPINSCKSHSRTETQTTTIRSDRYSNWRVCFFFSWTVTLAVDFASQFP